MKDKGEKERYTHLNAEFQIIARRDKKAFLSDQCKETEEDLQAAEKTGEVKGKGKIYPSECRVPETSKEE